VTDRPPFVDAHVHFWDHSVPGLDWAWLRPDFTHPRLGDLKRLDAPRYATEELRAETAGLDVTKVVHVQAAKTDDPAIETAWLQSLGERTGWPSAIIGYCDLTRDDVAAVVEKHAAFGRFRGVRDIPAGTRLGDPALVGAFDALERAGASVEIMTSYEHFGDLLRLIRAHPGLLVVIGHAGLPVQRDDAYFEAWSAGMRLLGAEPNAVCKISALAGAEQRWTVEGNRRWVLECIEAFSPQRCMLASNWPVDKLFVGYGELLDGLGRITAGLSGSDRRAIFGLTAERVYRI
jgi:predicted TIM-barrel fold metal-dependent hydrolase